MSYSKSIWYRSNSLLCMLDMRASTVLLVMRLLHQVVLCIASISVRQIPSFLCLPDPNSNKSKLNKVVPVQLMELI